MAHGQAESARRFVDLRLRIVSALVLAPIALALLWLGGGAWVALVVLAAGLVGVEWAEICGSRAARLPGVILPLLVAAAGIGSAMGEENAAFGVLALGAALFALGAWQAERGGWLAAGAVYAGVAAMAMVWLRGDGAAGRIAVLFVMLVVWASDIGAYLFGRLIGGPKLAPRISPGKTWAGAAGGLALAVGVGILVGRGWTSSTVPSAALIAGVLSLASQGGDLLESALKRRFDVKDSGFLIPGHGGVLDRLDGMLAAAPVAAILALAWSGAGLWR